MNLTLNTLFESATWLPAERRKADEPGDDWKWTLRSAANRPILRLAEDGDVIRRLVERNRVAEGCRASACRDDGWRWRLREQRRTQCLRVGRVLDDGAGLTLHADIGTQPGPTSLGPSTEVATGYGMRLGYGRRGADGGELPVASGDDGAGRDSGA